MIAAVLFDLDETLLDRTASLAGFLADQHARFAASLNISLALFRERFMALDARGMVPKSVVYPALLEEFGGPPEAAAALLKDYSEGSCRHAKLIDGADEVLSVIRDRGLKMGIVSNGETIIQWRNIHALALDDRMDVVLISEGEGLRKPDAAIFQRAADRLGVMASDCLFVGDNPVADVIGARNAGMQAVWFDNGMSWPEGEPGAVVIRRLKDLLPQLQ